MRTTPDCLAVLILSLEQPRPGKASDSPARKAAASMLESRAGSSLNYKNAIDFLAADANQLKELVRAAREYLAWKFITDEQEMLELNQFQSKQAETKCRAAGDGGA